MVFRALSDASRRRLLDLLFKHDGQTLAELCRQVPGMTRQGVMNHLKVLEEAGLLSTRRRGKHKHHYLNPIPIRLVYDRWIGKYTESVIERMHGVRVRAEQGAAKMTVPTHIYQAYIKATPDRVWQAIVDGDVTVDYFYSTRVKSQWNPGSEIHYAFPDGTLAAKGTVLAIEPGRRVEMTFLPLWDPELEAEGGAREVWLVEEEEGDVTKLTIELHDLSPDSKTFGNFVEGLPHIVSGMKTLLETGVPLSA